MVFYYVVYLKDGKTKVGCMEIKGAPTEEFLGIFNKICEKASTDCLKGYSKENVKAFKEYKKEYYQNNKEKCRECNINI